MHNFAPILAIALFAFVNYVAREFPALPSSIKYLPDVGVAALASVVVLRLILNRAWTIVPMAYVATMVGFLYVLAAGFSINGVSGDTVFAGLRNYCRYIPLFLIPFAFSYSETDLRFQSKAILLILLVQVPVSVWQRFFEFASLATGDEVRGTFGTSGALAIIGVAAIVVVCAMYFDKKLSAKRTILYALAFSLPASLAETKATPLLLIAGMGGLLLVRYKQINVRQVLQVGVVAGVVLATFVVIYDQLYGDRFERSVASQVTDPDYVLGGYQFKGMRANSLRFDQEESYDIAGADNEFKVDDHRGVGRFDSILIPLDSLFRSDKIRLLLGLGAGNVDSSFGGGGDYTAIKDNLGGVITSYSMLLWETGLLGTLFSVCFLLLVLRDSYRLSGTSGVGSTLGAIGFGVTLVYLLSMAYKNTYHLSEIQAIYVYVAGLCVAARVGRQKLVTESPRSRSAQPGALATGGPT